MFVALCCNLGGLPVIINLMLDEPVFTPWQYFKYTEPKPAPHLSLLYSFFQKIITAGSVRTRSFDSPTCWSRPLFTEYSSINMLSHSWSTAWQWSDSMCQSSSAVSYWTAAPCVCRNCNVLYSLKDSLSDHHTGFFCSLLPRCYIQKGGNPFLPFNPAQKLE